MSTNSLPANVFGVTGSPNEIDKIAFDVLDRAIKTQLVGSLVQLKAVLTDENGKPVEMMILGQVSKVVTANVWHENTQMAGVIRLNGQIPHMTGVADYTKGEIAVMGAYTKESAGWSKGPLVVPPGTGLHITKVNAADVDMYLQTEIRENERHAHHAYLGNFLGNPGVLAPVNVRHFGPLSEGGNDEAWMGAIFGPSGCGKSIMASRLIAGYAHNPKMGILIIDPQSEFACNKGKKESIVFDFHDLLTTMSNERFQRERDIVTIENILWEDPRLFTEMLRMQRFFKTLGLGDGKAGDAAEELADYLSSKTDWKMSWSDVVQNKTYLEDILETVASVYAARGKGRSDAQASFTTEAQKKVDTLTRQWDFCLSFFRQNQEQSKRELVPLLKSTITRAGIVILDINPNQVEGMHSDLKGFLLEHILKKLRYIAHHDFKQAVSETNCLIVFDEAHLFAPNDTAGQSASVIRLAHDIEQNVRMLRKMRCGMLFCTQNITQIRKDIYKQLHYCIYGPGLIADDRRLMEEKDGEEAIELYKTLPNPKQSKRYSFLVNGALVILGSCSRPMAIEGLAGGSEGFKAANKHLLVQ